MRPAVRRFKRYGALVEDRLMPRYDAVWHWAKIEPPADGDPARLEGMRRRLRSRCAAWNLLQHRLGDAQFTIAGTELPCACCRFPVARFNELRALVDPKNVLGSDNVDALLGTPVAAAVAAAT